MGQCFVRLKAAVMAVKRRLWKGGSGRGGRGGGGRQYRHKRYDYTPQRSWRYNDDQVLNQISLRGTEYDSPVWELEERGEGVGGSSEVRGRVLLNPVIDDDEDSEEEQGDTASDGRLVFAEQEETEETPLTPSPPPLTPNEDSGKHHRTLSTSSLKIGRFEVFEVYGGSGDIRVDGEGEERGERGDEDATETDNMTDKDTTQLLNNDLT